MAVSFTSRGNGTRRVAVRTGTNSSVRRLTACVGKRGSAIRTSISRGNRLRLFATNSLISDTIAFNNSLSTRLTVNKTIFSAIGSLSLAAINNSRGTVTALSTTVNFISGRHTALNTFRGQFSRTVGGLGGVGRGVSASGDQVRSASFTGRAMRVVGTRVLRRIDSAVLTRTGRTPSVTLGLLNWCIDRFVL